MPSADLFRRFPAIAGFVLSNYRDAIGPTNAAWLERHRSRNDWEPSDVILIREMLPAALHWLLQPRSVDRDSD